MTGAMYASIAGLKAHMSKLSVIGNNVANVNTQGYKTKRTVFRDALYRTYTSGSNGTAVVGGKNPSEIGYGSMVANIDLDMTSASYAPGNPMDCAIVGDGFFLVGDKNIAQNIDAMNPLSFKSLTLTRVGDFKVGADGYLTDGSGKCVYGFLTTSVDAEGKPVVSDQLVPIRMPRVETQYYTVAANGDETIIQPTEENNWRLTAEQLATPGLQSRAVVYYPTDTLDGNLEADTTQKAELRDHWPAWAQDENGQPQLEDNPLAFATMANISIDSKTGCITGVTQDTKETVIIGYIAVGSVTNPNGVSHEGSSYYRCGDGAGDLTINLMGGAANELTNFTFVNGSRVDTPEGADGAETPGDKARIGNMTGTEFLPGFLETSGADLATEISELITTQRGYQANTRIITVTDSMLEELVNMKR